MKYKMLMDDCIKVNGKRLYRIQALKDFRTRFGQITTGDVGGYIESEKNLSQDDTCWVFRHASVFGEAVISDRAIVDGHAMVKGGSVIEENALVMGKVIVDNKTKVFGTAMVTTYSSLKGPLGLDNCLIHGTASLIGAKHYKDREITSSRELKTVFEEIATIESPSLAILVLETVNDESGVVHSDMLQIALDKAKGSILD